MKTRLWNHRLLAAGLAASVVTGGALGLAGVPAAAAPTPGTLLFSEDFQNRLGPEPIVRLTDYTGANGEKYTADPAWLKSCNGWVASFNQPVSPGDQVADCDDAQHLGNYAWNRVQQLAWALGSHSGAADPADNYAVSAHTENDPGAGHVEFKTVSNIAFSGSNRYVAFSVDVAAVNCEDANTNPPLLQFAWLNESGESTPLGSQIDACSSPKMVTAPAKGVNQATDVHVGTYTSGGAFLANGGSIGIRMVNNEGSHAGNDHAFDNIRMLDVTPSVNKAFSPSTIYSDQTSKLTFTIENTSELASKNDFSFTDKLPAGVTIASDPGASTTCGNGTVNADAGGSSVALSGGDLTQGTASCTVTVNVSAGVGKYTNDPADFEQRGLNKPGPATLEVLPSVNLSVQKKGPWQAGPTPESIEYRITVTNDGPDASTGWTVTDTLPSRLENPSTSSPGCSISGGTVTCTGGPLPANGSRTITIMGTSPVTAEKLLLDNCVAVTGKEYDPETPNNDDCWETEILPIPVVDPAVGATAGALALGGGLFLRRRRNISGRVPMM